MQSKEGIAQKEDSLLAKTLAAPHISTVTAPGKVLAGLLQEIGGLIHLPAIKYFVAREEFTFGKGGGLALSSSSERFMQAFHKVKEENVPAAVVRRYKLLEPLADGRVLAALGGKECAKIALAHMCEFLKTKAENTETYFFFVPDLQGTLWDVNASFNFGRNNWNLDAVQVPKSVVMLDVHRVVSPA